MATSTTNPPLSAGGIHYPNGNSSPTSSISPPPPPPPSSPSSSTPFCPPFPNNTQLQTYLTSISPPRELICPITQELLKDPVIATDGHTYERHSLITWFEGMGRTRSPVTNSLLENTSVEHLVTNLAVASMASVHREKLGGMLMDICEGIVAVVKERGRDYDEDGVGVRVEGLLDAGADPNGRGMDGNTPLHLLIQSGNIHLATHLLNHDASVILTNDAGMDCIATAEQTFTQQHHRESTRKSSHGHGHGHVDATASEWNDFIQELKRRESMEKARTDARDRARNQANDRHREHQRTLAANAQSSNNLANNNQQQQRGGGGLGQFEEGVGYFPSLAALQFQSSIPGPSPSVAEYENEERKRLDCVLKWMCGILFVYLLLS